MKNYRIMIGSLAILCAVGLSGCRVTGFEEDQQSDITMVGDTVQFAAPYTGLQDDNSIYELQDDTSVNTFYLTVTQGNAAENTNHTWSTINDYSTYYYSKQGIERYAVQGLLQVGNENGPLAGELGYGEKAPNVTITVRGQTSSYNSQKNYKISIKDGKGSWNDQQVLNLNKHQTEGTRFRNKLMFDLMEEVPDLVSFRTQFVHLYVCDKTMNTSNETFEDYGLYTQVEQPNKNFLKTHGLDKNGHLYKINFFEFFRYEDVIRLKTDSEYDQAAFEEMLEIKGDDDHSKLIAMLEDVNNYNIPITEIVDKWFDKDNLLSWLSFQILTGNIDTQSRNTLIYSPLNADKWYFINWDCDTGLMRYEYNIRGMATENSWEHGISNYWVNVLFQRVFKDSSLLAELDTKVNQQREILTAEKIQEKIAAYSAVVKPYAYSYPDNIYEPLTAQQYDAVCNEMPEEIEKNYQFYLTSLKEPMPFYIDTIEPDNGGISVSWDVAYDFDAQDILYSFELSDTYDFSNIIYQEENIFIPECSYQKKLPVGQYFVRVKAKNEDGFEQSAFDYYTTEEGTMIFGVKCFYVLADGTIQEEVYEE